MKIAIITGASSGLGAGYVQAVSKGKIFREKLDEIWVIARREERLKRLAEKVKTPLRILPLDLTEKNALKTLSVLLSSLRPDVRLLINAAGFGKIGSWKEVSSEDAGQMIDLNCKAAVCVTQTVLPFMKKGGRIMEICSTAAFQPFPYLNVYAASKSFLYRYSRSLGRELRTDGISVTAVCPYWIKDTEFISVAKNVTGSGKEIHSFPLSSHVKSVVDLSLTDAVLRRPVSTPGIVCTIHRLFSFLPDGVKMDIWEQIRKL